MGVSEGVFGEGREGKYVEGGGAEGVDVFGEDREGAGYTEDG